MKGITIIRGKWMKVIAAVKEKDALIHLTKNCSGWYKNNSRIMCRINHPRETLHKSLLVSILVVGKMLPELFA